jgi:hypothetical protein
MINSSAVMEKILNSSNAAEGDTVTPYVKISIVANHSSFLFLKTIVDFNLVFPTNLTFCLKVSNDVFAAFYTVQNIDSTIFYAYSSGSIFPDPSK